jgi:hypothetical protein
MPDRRDSVKSCRQSLGDMSAMSRRMIRKSFEAGLPPPRARRSYWNIMTDQKDNAGAYARGRFGA